MFLARRNPWQAANCAARRAPHSQQATTYLHGKDYSMASGSLLLKQNTFENPSFKFIIPKTNQFPLDIMVN
jgi:hypothetical protein